MTALTFLQISFESATCGRCYGDGTYPSSAYKGICLQCMGKGWCFTPNGETANNAFEELILKRTGVPAETLKVGDHIYTHGDGGITTSGDPITYPRRWRKISSIEVKEFESASKGKHAYYIFTIGKSKGGEDVHYSTYGDALVRVPNKEETRKVYREIAKRYKGADVLEADTKEGLAAKAEEVEAARKADFLAKVNARHEADKVKREAQEAARKAKGRAWRTANRDLFIRLRDLDRSKANLERWQDIAEYIRIVKAGWSLSEATTAKAETAIDDWDAEQEELATLSHVGTVGEKVTLTVKVEACISIPDRGFGPKRLIKLTDPNGNLLIWWASWSSFGGDLDTGDSVTITAKVKAHGTYDATGEKQTTIYYVKRVK